MESRLSWQRAAARGRGVRRDRDLCARRRRRTARGAAATSGVTTVELPLNRFERALMSGTVDLLPGLSAVASARVSAGAAAARRAAVRSGAPGELLRLSRAERLLAAGRPVCVGTGRRDAAVSAAIFPRARLPRRRPRVDAERRQRLPAAVRMARATGHARRVRGAGRQSRSGARSGSPLRRHAAGAARRRASRMCGRRRGRRDARRSRSRFCGRAAAVVEGPAAACCGRWPSCPPTAGTRCECWATGMSPRDGSSLAERLGIASNIEWVGWPQYREQLPALRLGRRVRVHEPARHVGNGPAGSLGRGDADRRHRSPGRRGHYDRRLRDSRAGDESPRDNHRFS